jgi:hypothetical protein
MILHSVENVLARGVTIEKSSSNLCCFTVTGIVKNCIGYCGEKFYVLLTVHLGTNLVNNQLDAQFVCIYFTSLRVSSMFYDAIDSPDDERGVA